MSELEPRVVTGTVHFALRIGTPVVVEARAPSGDWSTVFEDDGQTGYFYGLEDNADEYVILDALHVYTVEQVVDQDAVYPMEIRWADGANVAGFFVEDKCHAIFNFDQRRAACRDNFPEATVFGFTDTHEWDEEVGRALGALE